MGDCVRINKRIVVAVILIAAALTAVVLAFFALNGEWMFRSEPQRHKPTVNLEKKPIESRTALTEELCRNALETDGQKAAYETISDYINRSESERFRLYSSDTNEFQIALNAYLSDHPEVFWLDDSSSYRYYEYDDSLDVELIFTQTGEELSQNKASLEAAVEKVAGDAPDIADDYEIELYLNDWFTENCSYNTDGGNKHSAYGALINGEAVCDGYSHAFQLLCNRLGVTCTVVEGTSEFNSDAEDGHMWNCVKLGESWYHIDVTWNDSSNAECGVEHYFYVNLNDEQIALDHSVSGGFDQRFNNKGNYFNVFLPKCDSDELNWFRLNGVVISDPDDDDEPVAALIEAAKNRDAYFACVIDEKADFNAVCDKIIDGCAVSWIKGANHFLGGDPKISEDEKIFSYESKRVLALQLKYE